jgi:hypothetical protein
MKHIPQTIYLLPFVGRFGNAAGDALTGKKKEIKQSGGTTV